MQRSTGPQLSQGATERVIIAVYQVHPIAAHGRHYKAKASSSFRWPLEVGRIFECSNVSLTNIQICFCLFEYSFTTIVYV